MYHNQQQVKPSFTENNDPRVTKFGRFIRKTHLDEIPQFFNTLIGEMSVVGPRPEVPDLVETFPKHCHIIEEDLKFVPVLRVGGKSNILFMNFQSMKLEID